MSLGVYGLLLVSISLGVVGQLSLKQGMSKKPGFRLTDLIALSRDIYVVGGFACYALSLLLYLKVLESLALSIAFPTISLGYAIVVILSGIIFNEPISRSRWAAVLLICIGVALVGLGA